MMSDEEYDNNEEGSGLAQAAVFEAIENQLADNSPPQVKETLDRLMADGNSREEAYRYIGCALCVELLAAMKHAEPYNEERYIRNLRALPKLPWDEE